jgi:5-methylcytosine-specific restriction protein A
MPVAAKHQCAAPGCRTLTDRKFCAACQPAAPASHRWDTDRRPTVRVRGRKLQAMRASLFAREPWCRQCRKEGRQVRATIRDHIVNLADGGEDDEDNTQPLCQSCSDIKTSTESRRGRLRQSGSR